MKEIFLASILARSSNWVNAFLNQGAGILCALISFSTFAQVANNSIYDRAELKLNAESTHSTTAHSTVEWACINKALTKKCLVYHNDQWFHFTPPVRGRYYLNLSSQQCRDLQGVQMIVIEGNPCEVSEYKILQCIPKIFLDDVFVELDSLKANTLYLINIDGFLGDFCEFDIQLSNKPAGLPRHNNSLDTLSLTAEGSKRGVLLKWHAHQSVLERIKYFEVHRLSADEKKFTLASIINTRGNALGNFIENYSFTDTLVKHGVYQYKIIGVDETSEERVLLDQIKVSFNSDRTENQVTAKVPFIFNNKGRVEVFVISKTDNELLDYSVREFTTPDSLSLNLTRFVDYGIREFWIKLRHTKTKELKQYVFLEKENGEHMLQKENEN